MAGTVEYYRQIVRQLLRDYAQIPYAYGELVDETIFDREADRYLLVTIGWQERKRIHTTILHLDVQDEKVWIQCNNTDQDIVAELIERGVSKEDIVLPALSAAESSAHFVPDELAAA